MTRSAFALLCAALATLVASDVVALGRALRAAHPAVVTPGDYVAPGETVVLRGDADPSLRADVTSSNGARRVWIAVKGDAGRMAWLDCTTAPVPPAGPGEWKGLAVRSRTAQFTLDRNEADQSSLPIVWISLCIALALLGSLVVPAVTRARTSRVLARAAGSRRMIAGAAFVWLLIAAFCVEQFVLGVTGRMTLLLHAFAAVLAIGGAGYGGLAIAEDGVLLWRRGWTLRARLVSWRDVVGVATFRSGADCAVRIVTRAGDALHVTSRRDPFVELLLQRTAGPEHGAIRVESGALVVLGERIPRSAFAAIELSEDGVFLRMEGGATRYVDGSIVLNAPGLGAARTERPSPRRCLACGGRWSSTAARHFARDAKSLDAQLALLERALGDRSSLRAPRLWSAPLSIHAMKCRRCGMEATVASHGIGETTRTLYVRTH